MKLIISTIFTISALAQIILILMLGPVKAKEPAATSGPYNGTGYKLVLRREYNSAALFEHDIAGDGASFSFSQNRMSGQESYDLNGAIIGGWRQNLNSAGFTRLAYSVGAFGQLHRGSGVDENDRFDKLGFALGMAWIHEQKSPDGYFKHGLIDTNLSWISDSNLELSVLNASADYKLYNTGTPNDPLRTASNGNRYAWGPVLSADYFTVSNDGGLDEYSLSKDFLYLGGGLEGEYQFWRDDAEWFRLTAQYQLQRDVIGKGGRSQYLMLQGSVPLKGRDGLSLNLTYETGQRPLGKGEVDQVMFGVSLRL